MVPSVTTEKTPPGTPPGIDPKAVRLVAQCLNHYAIPGPLKLTGFGETKKTDHLCAPASLKRGDLLKYFNQYDNPSVRPSFCMHVTTEEPVNGSS